MTVFSPEKTRILVVKADESLKNELIGLLEQWKFQIAGEARNVEAAWVIAEKVRLDLALMDVTLDHEHDGIRAAMHLRSQLGVPTMFLTDDLNPETMEQAQAASPVGYVVSPVSPAGLRAAVTTAANVALNQAQRLREEMELVRREDRFRRLFDDAVLGIFQTTAKGKILAINRAFARLFGYGSPDELMDMVDNVASTLYVDPDFRDFVVDRVLASNGPVRIENRFRRRNGDTFIANLHAWPVKDERRGMVFLEGFIEDITERRAAQDALKSQNELLQAQREELQSTNEELQVQGEELREANALLVQMSERLKESEWRHRLVSELTSDYIYFGRFESDGTVLIEWMTGAVEAITGFPSREVVRNPDFFYQMVHPEDTGLLRGRRRDILAGRSSIMEYRIRTKTKGATRWIRDYVRPVHHREDWGGLAVIGAVQDITDRKNSEKLKQEIENRLRQGQKLEAIGTLAGGIAHDFNNILAAILGYADLAVSEVTEDHPASYCLVQLKKSGLRARRLIQQILTFSRPSDQERVPLDLKNVIQEALNLIRASLPSTTEIQSDLSANPATVMADSTQMHQLLMNLASNSAHAMGETGGVLSIRLESHRVSPEDASRYPDLQPGSYLKLSVQDTGPGIDEKIIDRVFEPFFTTKTRGEGTGMGLAVVHGIVKSHGGFIEVSSTPGLGTLFQILLPTITKTAIQKMTMPCGPLPQGNERILLVDDEPSLLDVGSRILTQLGYRVIRFASAPEALRHFRNQPDCVDLVITDQTMPQLTGLDLAKQILTLRPNLPIILCTGFSHRVTPAEAQAAGIRQFVLKPLVARDLAEIVRQVLNGHAKG